MQDGAAWQEAKTHQQHILHQQQQQTQLHVIQPSAVTRDHSLQEALSATTTASSLPADCPSPEEVAAEIAQHVRATRSLPSRHVMRILPVSHSCFVSQDDLQTLAAKVAEQHFPAGEGIGCWWLQHALGCQAAGGMWPLLQHNRLHRHLMFVNVLGYLLVLHR